MLLTSNIKSDLRKETEALTRTRGCCSLQQPCMNHLVNGLFVFNHLIKIFKILFPKILKTSKLACKKTDSIYLPFIIFHKFLP